jgi:hypothetical protein
MATNRSCLYFLHRPSPAEDHWPIDKARYGTLHLIILVLFLPFLHYFTMLFHITYSISLLSQDGFIVNAENAE